MSYDIQEHGTLDWRLRELNTTIDALRRDLIAAIDANTRAAQIVADHLEAIDEHLPMAGRGF